MATETVVRIDRVVTKGGDKGETSLGDGRRVSKHAERVEAIGAVDEANAAVGWLAVAAPEHEGMLRRIQNELFDLGADVCVPGEGGERLRLTGAPVERLEQEVAAMQRGLPKLGSFVLPGGTEAAARAHLARTVVRRAERAMVRLSAAEAITPEIVRYLNRLSDHLFVLGRVLNGGGAADVLWRPGASLSDDVKNVEQDDDRDGNAEQP